MPRRKLYFDVALASNINKQNYGKESNDNPRLAHLDASFGQ